MFRVAIKILKALPSEKFFLLVCVRKRQIFSRQRENSPRLPLRPLSLFSSLRERDALRAMKERETRRKRRDDDGDFATKKKVVLRRRRISFNGRFCRLLFPLFLLGFGVVEHGFGGGCCAWWLCGAFAKEDDHHFGGRERQKTNNHAILVDASRFWFNYRHAANALAIYKTIKRLGIPDENIILMVADDYACNSRNVRAGEVFTDDSGYENNVYMEDIEVDYRGDEVTPANVLRVLLDAHYYNSEEDESDDDGSVLLNLPNSKRLRTDENSNVLFYLTGHGGDEFLKFQDQKEITSMDLQNAFTKMREMKRYNELLFVVDTCQAGTMFKRFNGLRNIIAVASSMKGENSYAHGTRNDIGLAVSDRFTRFLYEYLKRDNAEEITLREVFQRAQSPQIRSYLMSTVQSDWSNYVEGRQLGDVKVGDFFANAHSRRKKSRTFNAQKSNKKDEEAYATILPGFATASAFTSA